jgi:hypothetical protein
MAMMKLSGLQKTGKFVSADMFGANAVFSNTDDGAPTRAFEDAADALGVRQIWIRTRRMPPVNAPSTG